MQIWHVAETGSIGYVTLQEWKVETVVVKQKKKTVTCQLIWEWETYWNIWEETDSGNSFLLS